jgi:subtilase family serine protease
MYFRSVLLWTAIAALPLAAQPNRIIRPIDSRRTSQVMDQIHPKARGQFDQGAVELTFELNNLSLLMGPSAAQQADLDRFLAALQDPSSADYQKWLTPEEFADRFGPSQSDYIQVVAWIESQGFTIHTLAPSRNWIAFGGTAAQVQQAFHTEIHRYLVNGESHFANATNPSVPEAIAGVVSGFRGLHDFLLRPPTPAFTSGGGGHYLAPDDIATIYNLTPLYSAHYDGTGQKMVIAGQTAVNMTDIANFRTMFNLPANTPQAVLVPNRPNPGTVSGDVIEADLDLEWGGAVARGASLLYVYSGNVLDAVQYAVTQNLAPVISVSYGGCEIGGGGSTLRSIAQQANAEGITWVNASGDSGAAGCEASGATVAVNGPSVDLPASIPEVTAVGGSEFQEGSGTYWSSTNTANLASALSYIPETTWNDTNSSGLASSGGGASVVFSKPTWQVGAGVPADGARDLPDVSLTASAAHDGAILCNSGSCAKGISGVTTVVGGTSLATPLFAGISVLVNHYRVATGKQAQAGLGNMNPSLYSLAQTSTDAFHDITTGSNIVPCKVGTTGCSTGSFGYNAGVGYDLATGLGSVNGANLAYEWAVYSPAPAALVSVTVTPSTVSSGAAATLTVNLSAAVTSNTTVALSSTNAAFPVPVSVTVASGQSSTSITVHAGSVTSSTSGTVSATYLTVTKTANVTVAPVVLPSLTSVSVSPSTLAGGGNATVTITLSSAAPSTGASVALTTSNSTAFPLGANVTVPGGQSSVSLTVHTGTVTVQTGVTVGGTYNGVTKSGSVTLTPVTAPALSSLAISPSSVSTGSSAVLAVTLTSPALSAATVTLTTSNKTAFPVPASVTIAAGSSSVAVKITAGSVTASTPVTVDGTYQSVTKSAGVTVTAVSVPTVTAVSVSPSTVTSGATVTFLVTLSGPAPTGGESLTLTSSNPAVFALPSPVTMPAGYSSGYLTVRTGSVASSAKITVSASAGGSTQSAVLTVNPAGNTR